MFHDWQFLLTLQNGGGRLQPRFESDVEMSIAAHHIKYFLSHPEKESDNVVTQKKSGILKYGSHYVCLVNGEKLIRRNTLMRHFEILHHKRIYKYHCLDCKVIHTQWMSCESWDKIPQMVRWGGWVHERHHCNPRHEHKICVTKSQGVRRFRQGKYQSRTRAEIRTSIRNSPKEC